LGKLTTGKNTDLTTLMNSPNLKTLLRNLLTGIPADVDLTDLTAETATPLESALSIIQQVRTSESGSIIEELENLIDQIHLISGEYSL
jgi:hypothetical protein